MWIKHLLEELKLVAKMPMTMHCDNQAAIHIASNPLFHERTKHITQEKVEDGLISIPYITTRVQIVDMFILVPTPSKVEITNSKIQASLETEQANRPG